MHEKSNHFWMNKKHEKKRKRVFKDSTSLIKFDYTVMNECDFELNVLLFYYYYYDHYHDRIFEFKLNSIYLKFSLNDFYFIFTLIFNKRSMGFL